jgi:hypothetical protein
MSRIALYFTEVVLFMLLCTSTAVLADQGVTSPTHKKHMGKIVWSNNVVSFRSPDESAFKNKFSINEPIYGRIYYNKALTNQMVYLSGHEQKMRDGSYKILLHADGKPYNASFGAFNSSTLTGDPASHWTTWQFSPNPKKREDGEAVVIDRWVKFTRTLSPGEHKIRFDLFATMGQYESKSAIASGEFTLIIADGDKIKSTARLPADTYTGSDKAALKKKMKKALVGPVTKNANEILKITIPSKWKNGTYRRPPYLPYRKITGVVLWQDSNNDHLCRYTSYNFIQDKSGNNWSPVRFQSFCLSCAEGDVECP